MMTRDQDILNRINYYLDNEGLRKERLAKRMGKSTSALYANLSGKNQKTVQFAAELADVLGLSPTFFISDDFLYKRVSALQTGLENKVAFSAGKLSEEGRDGLEQIRKICDLVNIYE
ncbi:helix-turn-helix domain-containing protein [Paenibacillus sp. HW567]|uniref:helix-turn-helix domain-containing protein n=1 Tax=Paenibacillus sp. HW567 TaxID=1034769 RepID=UPI000363011D|nr:helix-turn-helix transcriptional regulator [Paenibacillus sp. HW567]